MIKIENVEVMGFKAALRGMRNPLDSWNRADSTYDEFGNLIKIGPNDESLMFRLNKAGTSHSKYLRMIHAQMDVTAPLYWWKDYDTYKVGTVANSCSTMHKIHAYEFDINMFAHEKLDQIGINCLNQTINYLNYHRMQFLLSENKDKAAWYKMVQILPSSYLQKRTLDLNYEVVLAILNDRRYHKQDEFREFCEALMNELPYIPELYLGRRDK